MQEKDHKKALAKKTGRAFKIQYHQRGSNPRPSDEKNHELYCDPIAAQQT